MLLCVWCVGIFGRGYWTPDEPREADLAWRMSWQKDKAVPQLAGEPFCEKPPLTYWLAALPLELFHSKAAWAARLPNLLYAVIAALGAGALARRAAGPFAGWVGAAAMGTFLLSYQVVIWLATDAPLLAAASVALLGAYRGFYAAGTRERLRGYLLMHAALGLGFLSKSAVAWMVPALTLATLVIWERRWRELARWELYAGLVLQAAMILAWIAFVYAGPDGAARLKVFFWNNLVGRFTRIDAPEELQYAGGHRNSPGKYLIELPVYLAPWTLLVAAAARRAWRERATPSSGRRAVRFALAASMPSLAILSVAATARNVYMAPALPGFALLLAWWAQQVRADADRWDFVALRATAVLLLSGVAACVAALGLIAGDAWNTVESHAAFIGISAAGLVAASALAASSLAVSALASRAATVPDRLPRALASLFFAYGALLLGPASQIYRQVDSWQNLAAIAQAIEHDAGGKPLILFAPDETTRAVIDMFARTSVELIRGPMDRGAVDGLRAAVEAAPQTLIVAQLQGGAGGAAQRFDQLLGKPPRAPAGEPEWAAAANLRLWKTYALPNGRRYGLLELTP